MAYQVNKILVSDFDEALALTIAALQAEGFGSLTEINVAETLHKKPGRISSLPDL